jgi:hypothetical protein
LLAQQAGLHKLILMQLGVQRSLLSAMGIKLGGQFAKLISQACFFQHQHLHLAPYHCLAAQAGQQLAVAQARAIDQAVAKQTLQTVELRLHRQQLSVQGAHPRLTLAHARLAAVQSTLPQLEQRCQIS